MNEEEKRQFATNIDSILQLLKQERYFGFKLDEIILKTGLPDALEYLTHLETLSLVAILPDKDGVIDYILTPEGLRVCQREEGYYQHANESVDGLVRDNVLKELQLKKLSHDVSISKWQFWVMIIGAIAGFISLIFTAISFFSKVPPEAIAVCP